MADYLIAHDLGTSGDKASLFQIDGTYVTSCTVPYEVNFFDQNKAEQNPDDWWNAVCTATKRITDGINRKNVLALSFSAQMQCCLIVNQMGEPIRPAIIWADGRAVKEADLLSERVGFDRMYELTGHRVSAAYSIEKLMWLKENESENYQQAYKMLQVKDYIIYKMTGKFVTDYSDASGTNAMDLKKLCWSKEILSAADIDEDKLPELHASTDVAGELTTEAAKELGLSIETKVVIGGGDGPCSAVGAGCIHADELFLTFGTSAWIGGTTKEVFTDKDKVLFCFAHVIPGAYMPCGTMQAAGSAYSYIKNALCKAETTLAKEKGEDPYEVMNQIVGQSPVGAKGLIFLPYLIGERSPRWNPDTSGSFLGIKMCHEKADYIRAVLEGIGMNLELILEAYRKQLTVKNLIFTGGGAKGDVTARILSDILNVVLTRPDHVEEATSIAAAVIAGVGIGIYQDFEAVQNYLSKCDSTEPDIEHVEIYQKMIPEFDRYYKLLYK